ncbi:MAG: aminoglycoside phosphotransferase family protein [Chitinophagaceae bacterium]|nr:aminoglycoside phosphotransferase family protein [Chitinophagaceae bacterium]
MTETNMIHYLLGNGLTTAGSFIKGNYSCRAGNGRHRHFIINKEFEEQKLFIKQAQLNNDEKTNSILKEGIFYTLAATDNNFEELRQYLPAVLLYDEKNAALVLEYYHDHISLYDGLMNAERDRSINKIAGDLAVILFSLHSVKTTVPGFLDEVKPWILQLAGSKRQGGFTARSVAEQQGIELIFSIQGFEELIANAAQLWEASCIIHGDSKLNNFLLNDKDGKLKWIDWEIVAAGDPLWDVATVFQSVLTSWVVSQDPLFSSENKIGISTDRMQEFIAACWKKYAGCNGWNIAMAKEKLEKCTAFTALRVLHSCFETTPNAKNLQPYSARLLQLAHNILSNPAQACVGLFGINPEP